ncbi:MAG: hypothetical protein ABUT20_59095 [Bacteroidota bacterium]
MKKIICCCLILLMLVTGKAQVVINPMMPTFGLTLKCQLWNMSLVNASSGSMQIQIQILLTDASNNVGVISGTSPIITLNKAATQITPTDISPVTYNVLSTGYGLDAGQDGFLPVGTFNLCYTVNQVESGKTTMIAQECDMVEVDPLSPPSLVSPNDSEHIEISRPLFTWVPPVPYNLFTNLTYGLTLVEVQPTQSSAEAIQQNVPIESPQNINGTSLQYDYSLPELDTGKIYAWQVTANNGYTPVSKSEIWVFKIRKVVIDSSVQISGVYYTSLKRTNDASIMVSDGKVRFGYYNEANDPSLNFTLNDISGAKQLQVTTDSSFLTVDFGQNYKELDLSNALLLQNHIYLLDFVNAKNEHWYLKFEYIKPQ